MTDFELMGAALDEARKAAALGEVPVGAVADPYTHLTLPTN